MKEQGPKIVRLGNLNTVVREHGKNNDDGDGWSIKADDPRRPPERLKRGLRGLLFTR